MIGILLLSIVIWLIIVCPLVGHFFSNYLGLSAYCKRTIKEYFRDHSMLSFWIGIGFEMPNVAVGGLISLGIFAIGLIIFLIANGI